MGMTVPESFMYILYYSTGYSDVRYRDSCCKNVPSPDGK